MGQKQAFSVASFAFAFVAFFVLLAGCCPKLPISTTTTVTVRDTTVTVPAVTSADTLCYEEAVDLAVAILSVDSVRPVASATLVDTATGVVVTLSVTPSGGLAVRTVAPKRDVTIRGAIRDSTVVTVVPVKGKPPNTQSDSQSGWVWFAVGFALGAVLMLVGIILLRRLTA